MRSNRGSGLPVAMASARSLPTIGAIMKPCPMKPDAWKKPSTLVDRPDDRVRVGGEVVAAGPLAEHLHVAEHRAGAHERARVVPEEGVRAVLVQPVGDPLLADAADDLAARGLAEVEAVGQVGDERLEPGLERLGRADLVAVRLVRQIDAEHPRDARATRRPPRSRPCASRGSGPAAVRSGALAGAARRRPRRRRSAVRATARRPRVNVRDLDAELPRRLREAPDERPREDDPVVRVVARGDDAVGVELGDDARAPRAGVSIRVARPHSFWSCTLASSARRISSVRARKRYPPCRNQTLIFISRANSRHIRMLSCISRTFALARPLRPDPSAVAPARAAAQVALVDDDDARLALPEPREVVGDRQPHDARADDDDLRALGQGHGAPGSRLRHSRRRCRRRGRPKRCSEVEDGAVQEAVRRDEAVLVRQLLAAA